jgi:hypothetical protein
VDEDDDEEVEAEERPLGKAQTRTPRRFPTAMVGDGGEEPVARLRPQHQRAAITKGQRHTFLQVSLLYTCPSPTHSEFAPAFKTRVRFRWLATSQAFGRPDGWLKSWASRWMDE